MKQQYVSSIMSKYGDVENVKQDVKTLREILARQGSSLLIDVIAEVCGETANKFQFHSSDRAMTMIALVDELESALKERL
jgi:hypothetical protein